MEPANISPEAPEEKIDLKQELKAGKAALEDFEAKQQNLAEQAAKDPQIAEGLKDLQESLWQTFLKGFGFNTMEELEKEDPELAEMAKKSKQGLWDTFKSGFGFGKKQGPEM